MKTILVLAVLLSLLGCSPPKAVADRLKDADRVIVTNQDETKRMAVTGEEVNRIVQAILSAKKQDREIKSAVGYRLQFFKGTNFLGSILASDLIFGMDHIIYNDTTGTLKAVLERFDQMESDKSP